MRSRSLSTVPLAALLAGLGLTACGSGAGPGAAAGPPKAEGAAPVSGAAVPAAPLAGQSTTTASAAPASPTPVSAPTAAPSSAPTATAPTADGAPQDGECRAEELRWTLTRLTATADHDPANAELVALNSGSHGCTLAGYPKLEFHLGKGPQATGAGRGGPVALALGPGKRAVFALRYSEMNGKGPDSGNCNPLVTAGAAEVTAPGGGAEVRVPVVDQAGKPARVTVCGQEVRLGPPVAR
ncbi:DUF4232 domain-containing protein [Kitasatospora sp. NPDC101176]|uniref:DUF4232 domain-containing protein n=1 Tax=Kitasatospora sp. NPDC101176 TaxID=3364099 RepID=UPI003823773E